MTNTVTFPTTGGSDAFSGKVASDGGSGTGDAFLANDGHRTWFIVILQWLIAWGAWLMARAGVAFVTTSSSSVTISSTGDYSFTVPLSLTLPVGAYATASSNAAPSTNNLYGVIKSYNSATGALVLTATAFAGSGAHTDWTIASSGPRGAAGAAGTNTASNGVRVSGSAISLTGFTVYTSDPAPAASGISGGACIGMIAMDCTSAARTLTFPAAPTVGDWLELADYGLNFGAPNALTLAANTNKILGQTGDVTINTPGLGGRWLYADATRGWIPM